MEKQKVYVVSTGEKNESHTIRGIYSQEQKGVSPENCAIRAASRILEEELRHNPGNWTKTYGVCAGGGRTFPVVMRWTNGCDYIEITEHEEGD